MSRFNSYFSVSILFHVVVLSVLLLSFDFNDPVSVLTNADQDMKILNAVVLDAPAGTIAPPKTVAKPKIKPAPIPMPKKEVAAVKPVIPKKIEITKPQPKTDAIAIEHKQEKKLLAKQLLDDLQKEVQQQKKQKHKAIEHAFEKEMKASAAKILQQQLLQENDRLANVQSEKARGIVNKYKALILQAISQNWLVPTNVNKKLFCELLIRTQPGGAVVDAQVVKSSGDVALDRSARAAVFKASPLPVPAEPNEFAPFKEFILKVKPENIIDG